MRRRRNRRSDRGGRFATLVLVLAVPILRLRHTVDAATRALRDVADQTGPMLSNVNATIGNVNTALSQVHTTLDGVNMQLARIDHIAENAQHVIGQRREPVDVVTAAAANPLVKVAAFGYRRAQGRSQETAPRDEESQVRAEIKRRRKAAGIPVEGVESCKRMLWLGIGLAVGRSGRARGDQEGPGVHTAGDPASRVTRRGVL